MTVIAVKRTKNKIIIGSDSQTTRGRNKFGDTKKVMYPNASKIFEVNGMVIGCAGNVVGNALMSVFAKTHQPKIPIEDDVIAFMVEFNEWAKKQDKDFNFRGNHFFIVFKKVVFEVMDGLLVREVGKFSAIGSGMFLALGALYYNKTIKEAVQVAKEYDLYCGGKTIIKEISI